jgi:hypothetical protein
MGDLIQFPGKPPKPAAADKWEVTCLDWRITADKTEVSTSVLNDPRISYGAKGLYAVLSMRADADLHLDVSGIPGWGTPEVEAYRQELLRYTILGDIK